MEATQNLGRWLPVLIEDEITHDGIAGIVYDDIGLSVKYTPPGDVEYPLVLTAATWREGQLGVYEAYFPGTAFPTVGLWLYYCTYTGATPYLGAIDVVPTAVETPSFLSLRSIANLQALAGFDASQYTTEQLHEGMDAAAALVETYCRRVFSQADYTITLDGNCLLYTSPSPRD